MSDDDDMQVEDQSEDEGIAGVKANKRKRQDCEVDADDDEDDHDERRRAMIIGSVATIWSRRSNLGWRTMKTEIEKSLRLEVSHKEIKEAMKQLWEIHMYPPRQSDQEPTLDGGVAGVHGRPRS